MAHTPEELQVQLDAANATIAQLKPLAEEFPTIKEKVALYEKEITDLKSEVSKRTQESQLLTLKSEFPDVPLELLPKDKPFEEVRAYAAKLMEFKGVASKGGPAAPPQTPQEPAAPWKGIRPATPPSAEVEAQARAAALDAEREKLMKTGDAHAVGENLISRNWNKIATILGGSASAK